MRELITGNILVCSDHYCSVLPAYTFVIVACACIALLIGATLVALSTYRVRYISHRDYLRQAGSIRRHDRLAALHLASRQQQQNH